MKPILETRRFLLREFVPDDAESLFNLNADPMVIKHTGDVAFQYVDEAAKFIRKYEMYSKYGFGRWAVIDKLSNEFTGWCGLKYSPEKDETDLGYRFFQKFWGKGYATEVSQVCLDAAFTKFGIREVIARAVKSNPASIRVMEKIGMQFRCDFEFHNQPGVIYFKAFKDSTSNESVDQQTSNFN